MIARNLLCLARRGLTKSEQREDAAFPFAGTHNQNGIFDGDDDNQRPEDERYDSQHGIRAYLTAGSRGLDGHASA